MNLINTKKCLICKRPNDTVYFHLDEETGDIFCWCCACQRGYGLTEYTYKGGVSLKEFLRNDIDFISATPNEVNSMAWPEWFIPLHDPRAKEGRDYVLSRGLIPAGDMYFDMDKRGIAFPCFFGQSFCGAQIRLLSPWKDKDGKETKMISLSGTRVGLLFYNWNQTPLFPHIKAVVTTEGAFNCLALQQSFDKAYGEVLKNPWKFMAMSGSGVTQHHSDCLLEFKAAGLKVVSAVDNDEAGLKALKKLTERQCVTHRALCEDTEEDWNDVLGRLGPDGLVSYFLSRVRSV